MLGPAHGHQIAKHIQRTANVVLQVEHSLIPALHRLERRGSVSAKWETPRGNKRECQYYRLTPGGKKRLIAEQSKWRRIVATIGRVMEPTEEG